MAEAGNFFLCYFVTKLMDKLIEEGFEIAKKSVANIVENIAQLTPELHKELPSVCLVGLGRCGTNVCEDVRDILVESRGSTATVIRSNTSVTEVIRAFFVQELQSDASAFLKVSSEPMIVAIDLDINTFQRLEGRKSQYSRFIPVEVDWPGGAGNIQIIGEYQARKLLTLPPERIKSKNWKNVFSYLVDSAGLAINPARVYFYVFSTGGGTGSGMSTEMGFAQKNAEAQRRKDIIKAATQININTTNNANTGTKTNTTTTDQITELGFTRAPIFSCALGVLPEMPDMRRVSEAVHLNSGRLLCKFLALTKPIDEKESTEVDPVPDMLPWNCLVLISNESVISKLRSTTDLNVTAGEFEKITNLYVAQQVFNLLSAHITADDVSKEDWELFGIGGGERLRLDATDLVTALYGLNAVAFDQETPTNKGEFSLTSLFLNSLRPSEVIDKGAGKVVRGISVLPGILEKYENLFDEKVEEIPQRLSEVPMFKRAVSSLTVVSLPKDYRPDTRDVSELKRIAATIFNNAKVRRYSVVRSISTDVAITTFISGNSVILTTECLLLLSSYMRRCFSCDSRSARDMDNIFYKIIENSKNIKKEERLKMLDDLMSLTLNEEQLAEFTAAPFSQAKDVHEAAFLQVNPAGFKPITDLRLRNIDLKRALLAIIDAVTYELDENIIPNLL